MTNLPIAANSLALAPHGTNTLSACRNNLTAQPAAFVFSGTWGTCECRGQRLAFL